MGPRENIGIIAIDEYIPSTFVNLDELEDHDHVSKGKYTIGLGQKNMGFCSDREDVVSISMSAVTSLMTKNNLSYKDIGRLEVGTETFIDKSKSVKTGLMNMFAEKGNTDVEGVTSVNGCYGGTAALFNSVAWVESSDWDGRNAMVVCADIAVYAEGNARPTGGAGAVAMIIGPNAPIVFEPGVRSTYCTESWDFYKPKMNSEYPVVDGVLSQKCYLNALDHCAEKFVKKMRNKHEGFSACSGDYYVFHSPYSKLVQKAFARLSYLEFKEDPSAPRFESAASFRDITSEESLCSRDLEMAFRDISANEFAGKVVPSLHNTKNVGNIYTGAVYGNLLSLVSQIGDELVGKRIVCFSYGSGLIASMFSLRVESSVAGIARTADLFNRLEARTKKSPIDFEAILKLREEFYGNCDITPKGSIEDLASGTWYLNHVSDRYCRSYTLKQ